MEIHLGRYLFSQRDIYFFEADQDGEYSDKTVTGSLYRGARKSLARGGSRLSSKPALDMIATVALDPDYCIGKINAHS